MASFYPAKVTSNAPVVSRISPLAVRARPSAMSGRNIQYFRRIATIARSCSAQSVRKRAVLSQVSPPMVVGGMAKFRCLWETVSMAKKRTKLDRSQRQSDRLEKRLNGTRREAAKKKAREDVNQAVERTVRE